MSENIKNTAITAAGYIYQNRQGLNVLCDWLDAPTRYRQVKFECDNESDAPQGLDDIVIERSDGRIDFQQVKFTPNPDVHLFSWEWLLEKSGKTARSRSILRKLFDAFRQIHPAKIGEISLITNRRPNAAIEACLKNTKISLSDIPEPNRSAIVAELGSAEACEAFFEQLRIRHSDKGYLALEHEVAERLRPHGTPEGIAVLNSVAINWAIEKNCPPPDGWITLKGVRDILQASPPAPLPEDFVVPHGYEVPDEAFHQEFVQQTLSGTGKVLVLTGPPGRGKSTYLSALCDTLAEQNIPTVRHHYFLSTTERGRDRINSYVVEQSIQAQVARFHDVSTQTAGGLRSLLETCASHYKTFDKPFVLILDGLDHVWRSNAEDNRPLDDLFRQIIPCPDNLVLLVGTQPADDAQLPMDLLASAPKDEWYTLPAMSENAVLSYLRNAVQTGRLTTGFEGRQAEEQLQGAASALRARTNGHPLHVIYATAELEHAGRRLSDWDIEQLKGDLSGDAKLYYGSLWVGLLPSLKDTLRLICAFPFFWPKSAFAEIAIAVRSAEPDVAKVEHLLHSSAAGLKVFHESLAVFVRTTTDYEERIKELMPVVVNWLERFAPTALRVNWLWTIQAKSGKSGNLITGLTRDWIMRRLCDGYPTSLFDTLLSDALTAALETTAFADAYRLAHLKARMVDDIRFQLEEDDLARLISFTLTLTEEESVIREAFASRHESDILHVAALGLALHARGSHVQAKICGKEVLRRFVGASRFSSRYRAKANSGKFLFLASAFAHLGTIGATTETLIKLVEQNLQTVWMPCVRLLIEKGSLDDLMAVAASLADGQKKDIISDACIRATATSGVNITEREDFNALARTPLVATVEAVLTRSSKPLNASVPVDWLSDDYSAEAENLAVLAHHWFFSAVHSGVCMAAEERTSFTHIPAPVYAEMEHITHLLNALSSFGVKVADSWWRREFVDFHRIFKFLDTTKTQPFRQNYHQILATQNFQAALHRIACDIRLVSSLLSNTSERLLTKESMCVALQCTCFKSSFFLEQYASRSLTRMTDEAAAEFVRSQRALLDTKILGETSMHLQTPLQLCAIAIVHGLHLAARELCKQAWELTTGYGHRKDPTLSNTIETIGYLVDVAPEDARRLLAQIAPQIHHVLEYTDGKGTWHVLAETDQLLAKLKPSALVVKYQEHTHEGDWSAAESSLQAYVEQGIVEGWPLQALMRTGLHPTICDLLQQHAQNGSAAAAEHLCIIQGHNGWEAGVIQREEPAGSNSGDKPYEGDVTNFGPDQLEELLKDLSSSYSQRKRLLRAWYRHWEGQSQIQRLLSGLDGVLFSKNQWAREVLPLADLAFQTKRKMSGLPAAWKYLVHAQICAGGWFGYEQTATIHDRLDLITRYYPRRCDEFVTATTYGMFDNPAPSRVAPSEVMVYFYIKQGKIADAIQFAETMVQCVIEDTRTLPLQQPRWGDELVLLTGPEVR